MIQLEFPLSWTEFATLVVYKESIKKNVTILVYLVPAAFGRISETYAPLFEVGIFHILNIKY